MAILIEENKLYSQKARRYSQRNDCDQSHWNRDELNKRVVSILKTPGCEFLRLCNKPNSGKLIIKKFNKQTFLAQDLSDCCEKVKENVNFLNGDTFPFLERVSPASLEYRDPPPLPPNCGSSLGDLRRSTKARVPAR